VGEEQSGHIKEVGIELYQQMLEDTVAQLKAGRKNPNPEDSAPDDWSPQINLGLPVLIPEEYVADLPLRLGLYRRVAEMTEGEDVSSFAAELVDRFGPLPQEVSYLIAVLGIKLLCKKAGIDRIDAGPKGAVISFRGNAFAAPDKLLAYVDKHIRFFKVRPDMKLVYTHEWKDDADKITRLRTMAEDIAKLAEA
jgi:transcription-repair coupling factor (superfamily II helicase)